MSLKVSFEPNWQIFEKMGEIHSHSQLLPVSSCQAVLSELAAPKPNASQDESAQMGKMLVGCYPQRLPEDLPTYALAIQTAFAMFPAEIGWEAANDVTLKCKFMPSRAEVFEALQAASARRTLAIYRARSVLLEHARRKTEAEREAKISNQDPEVLAGFENWHKRKVDIE